MTKRKSIGYIYMFTNRINGKKYIGQHEYKNEIDERYFGSGTIFNNAKNKYGIENFKFDILCWCDSKEELDNAESYYIGFKYYTYANTGRGYNVADGGYKGNNYRGKTKEEMDITREKMRKSKIEQGVFIGEKNPMYGKTGEKHPMYGRTGEKSPRARKVRCLEEEKVFDTIKEACEWAGLKSSASITFCCQGKQKVAGGYHWEYVN